GSWARRNWDCGRGRRPPPSGSRAELVPQRGRVEQGPVLSELAVVHADHVDAGDLDMPPGRSVRAAEGVAVDREITGGDVALDRQRDVPHVVMHVVPLVFPGG